MQLFGMRGGELPPFPPRVTRLNRWLCTIYCQVLCEIVKFAILLNVILHWAEIETT